MDGSEDKVLSAVSQAQQRKCSFHFYRGPRAVRSRQAESRACQGLGRGAGGGRECLTGTEFQFCKIRVQKTDGAGESSDVSVRTPPSHTLKKGSEANFLLFFLPQFKKSAMGFKKDPLFY